MKSYFTLIVTALLISCFSLLCFAKCLPADLNGDCRVDLKDFAVLADGWMDVYDFDDLASLVSQWLADNPNFFFEGFETGDFSKYSWEHSGDANWVIVSDTVFEGSYAVQSGAIIDDQNSTIEITLDTQFNAISFCYKVSSEEGYDFLQFYIDGELQDEWSGEQGWAQQTYSFAPGEHTFTWSYAKDGSETVGGDCAWIDNITFCNLNLVTIPDVVGMTQSEAQAAIIEAGLVAAVSEQFSNTVAQGYVISQSPSSGENILFGDAVNLVVSAGAAPVAVLGMTWVYVDDTGFGGEGYIGEMSKYETTNAQYCEFLNSALASGDIIVSGNNVYGANGSNAGNDFADEIYYRLDGIGYNFDGAVNGGAARINYNGSSFTVASGMGNHPANYVSWYGATAFCNYYGFRLPAKWEWNAVADYTGGYNYGCGTTINNTKANYLGSTHPHGTTEVGAFGEFGYGMCDMAGNVFEWVSEFGISAGAYRGGSWNLNSLYCQLAYDSYFPALGSHNVGFRVCR